MSAKQRRGCGCAAWAAAGCGCLVALIVFMVVAAALWFGVRSERVAWPPFGREGAAGPTASPAGDAAGTSSTDSAAPGPVAPGDAKRLALDLPKPGEDRSETSIFHRGAALPGGDDFVFDDGPTTGATTGATPAATPTPNEAPDLDARLAAARRRRDAAFERYTRLVTEGGEGDVNQALAEYRAAVEALAALERQAAARR